MKPDWKDAPDWAQWLAMDANGIWYWYETEPDFRGAHWGSYEGRTEQASPTKVVSRNSLEKRP